jgi:O-antigen ligase
MAFLYSFLHFLQPGILWPELAPARPAAVVLVVGLLAGAAARPGYSRAPAFRNPVFFWLALFLLAQVMSVHYSGISSMFDEFAFWLPYLLFVIGSFLLIHSERSLRAYVWGLIVGTMFIVAYGIYAALAGLNDAIQGRAGAYGMYENHNDYSFAIIMVLPFVYMVGRIETGFARRAFLGLSLLACCAGIFLSLSRGGVLALVLELALIAWLTAGRRWRVVVLIALAFVGAAAVSWQWTMRAENQGSNYTAEDAETSRLELWRAGRAMIEDRPLLGVGSRRFGEWSEVYGEISHDNRGKNSHNTYIEVAATSGLLGFLPFAMMLFRCAGELRRRPAQSVSKWIDAIRLASLICLLSIMFRALLDAKPHDWSFYVVCSLAIATGLLQRKLESAGAAQTAAATAGSPGLAGVAGAAGGADARRTA